MMPFLLQELNLPPANLAAQNCTQANAIDCFMCSSLLCDVVSAFNLNWHWLVDSFVLYTTLDVCQVDFESRASCDPLRTYH